MDKLRIRTLVGGKDAVRVIPQLIPYGFESFSITFWQTTGGIDLEDMAKKVGDVLAGHDVIISCLSLFGNPLMGEGESSDALASWERLIDSAHLFGTDLVTGFTGRIVDRPIDESIPRFKEVFGELARRAADKGVRLAFENCNMGGDWQRGDWNIAHNPLAWEMMFDALPLDNLGLEWEPCHQMVQLIDPIPQLRKWANKIFQCMEKTPPSPGTLSVNAELVEPFVWHRTPGFGDSNWTDIISILRYSKYEGTIDIEGYHDPVYCGELEMTGQVRGLQYLKQCRGGEYVANPV